MRLGPKKATHIFVSHWVSRNVDFLNTPFSISAIDASKNTEVTPWLLRFLVIFSRNELSCSSLNRRPVGLCRPSFTGPNLFVSCLFFREKALTSLM